MRYPVKLHVCALLSSVFLFLAASSATKAQTSVYGTVMTGAYGVDGGNNGDGSFKSTTGGVVGGVFYTFHSDRRFKMGIDGRVMYSPGYDGGSAYTAAFRIGWVPTHVRLRPYFQIGTGVVTTQINQVVCTGFTCGGLATSRLTNSAVQIDFGLDIRITNHFDIRAIDYGADVSGSNNNTDAAVGFLDAGIVYHFRSGKT